MKWNWQQKDWPNFSYKKAPLEELEAKFLRQSGLLVGTYKHISDEDKKRYDHIWCMSGFSAWPGQAANFCSTGG